LPTAALIGSSSYSVIGVDIDGNKVIVTALNFPLA
jgi:UDP-N-acetyl-D-mannosaminuronate dehydrogenase